MEAVVIKRDKVFPKVDRLGSSCVRSDVDCAHGNLLNKSE